MGESKGAPHRILLIEDDTPVRERLAHILMDWPGGTLIAACASLGEALEKIRSEPIDLMITDLKLPDGNGIEAIVDLREKQPQAEAMVISALGDHETVIAAIKAGATGFLLKDAEAFNMIEALEELVAGGSPVSPIIARTIIEGLNPHLSGDDGFDQSDELQEKLTEREVEILEGITKGLSYAELAETYGISRNTVPVHIRNIYRKLETHNRSQTVYEAVRRGIITMT